MTNLKLWVREMKEQKKRSISMVNKFVKKLNRKDRRFFTKNSPNVTSDLKFLKKAKKCSLKGMTPMETQTYHPQFQISLWIYMRMHREEKKDKIRYTQHVWSQSVHSNQTQTRLSTTIRNLKVKTRAISNIKPGQIQET